MKRLPLLLLSGLAVAAMAACGGKKPETTPAPVGINADSAAEADPLRAGPAARAARDGGQAVRRQPRHGGGPHRDRVLRRGAAARLRTRRGRVGAESPRRVRDSLRRREPETAVSRLDG